MKKLTNKAEEILEGWGKYSGILNTSKIDDEIAKERAAICSSCPFAVESDILNFLIRDNQHKEVQGYKCSKCGCPLSTKIRSTTSKCPENKWLR